MDQSSDAGEHEGSRSAGTLLRVRAAAFAVAALISYAAGAQSPELLVEVKLLSREQVLAFYSARGFSANALRPYADACVLSFTLHNDTATTLRYRLADWKAGDVPFTAVESWEQGWENAKVAQSARIAFRWAQLPPDQEFAPGDWIMGMAALSAHPMGTFRITVRYQGETGAHESATEPLRCVD